MPVLGAQAAQHIEHLAHLTHRLADVAKRIGELLEAAGVLLDVHVALDKVPVLHFQIDGAVKFVVTNLGMDAGLDLVHRGFGTAHDGTHVLVDGDVDLG
jgi:hypothetical protein